MADNPTIIVGHLDDSDLRKSIDSLVLHIETQTKRMSGAFDSQIEKMKSSMRGLKTEKLDTDISSTGKSSKQAKDSFDNVAQAISNVTSETKKAEDSFNVFIQNYRDNAAKLSREIKEMPSLTTERQFAEYQKYEEELKMLTQLLQKYKEELNDIYKNPNATRQEKQSALGNIDETKKLIREIEAEQIRSVKRVEEEDRKSLEDKKRRLEEIKKTIHDLTIEEKKSSSASSSASSSSGGESSSSRLEETTNAIREQREEKRKMVNELKAEIDALKLERGEMLENTAELRAQDNLIAEKEEYLKRQLMSEEQLTKELKKQEEALERARAKELKKAQSKYTEEYNAANSMSSKSLSDAEAKLERLIKARDEMKKSGLFDEVKLNRAQQAIDRISQKIERMKSRQPLTLKQVLGMDESSVDAISKKMQALKMVQVDTKNAAQVKELGNEYQRLSRLQSELLGKGIQLTKSNNYLAQSFGYIRNRIVYALTLGAITNFTKQLYEVRSQYELLERSIGVLVDSFAKGSQIFNELNAMALKSPFTLIELGTAAKQLTAYNFAADEVVDVTRRLADLSAALGVPMERLTYNLGQIRAQTVLTARDARDFANAGLPIVSKLADYYSNLEGRVVSTGDVFDRMSKKAVSFNDVMEVLNSLTDKGGKFFDFQAKQAETLRVQMANLNLAFNNMLNSIGTEHQSMLETPLALLRTLFENWRALSDVLTSVIVALGAVKAAQVIMNTTMGISAKAINGEILANKRKMATDLERKALVEGLNAEELALYRTRKVVTAQDYRAILATKNLTKEQALLLVSFNRNNKALSQALIRMGLLSASEIRAASTGKGMALMFNRIELAALSAGRAIKAFLASNWVFLLIGAATELYMAWSGAKERMEALNKSISDNAKESTENISKFFDEYKNSLGSIDSLSLDEQNKLWERMQEEIKLVVSNADDYLKRLNEIEDVSARIKLGEDVLSDIENINKELERFSNGEFLDTSAEIFGKDLFGDLQAYQNVIKGLKKSISEYYAWYLQNVNSYSFEYSLLYQRTKDANEEIDNFVDSLNNLDVDKILGKSGDLDVYISNLRYATGKIVENMLASEKGARINAEGIALINKRLDLWITKQLTSRNLIDEQRRDIEAQRSAWMIFFDSIERKDKDTFDFLVESGETASSDFQNIWEKAAENMKATNKTAYNEIQSSIESLRSEPSIVIDVIYNIKKQGGGILGDLIDKFVKGDSKTFQEQINNRQKYGRFLIKEGEGFLAYEKRLREEHDKEIKELKTLENARKRRTSTDENANKEIDKQIEGLKESIRLRKEVAKYEGIELTKPTKNGGGRKEDTLATTIGKEIQIVKKLQGEYKKLVDAGIPIKESIKKISEEYVESVNEINKILAAYKLPQLNLDILQGRDQSKIKEYFDTLKQQIKDKGLANLKRLEPINAIISEINLEAKTINTKKIADGLNNELSKLKDEFEISMEFAADENLANALLNLFGIDASSFPKTIDEYMKIAQDRFDKFAKREMGYKTTIDIFKANDEKWEVWRKQVGITEEALQAIKDKWGGVKQYAESYFKKLIQDTQKTNYQLGDTNYKLEVEKNKLENLKKQLENESLAFDERENIKSQIENQKKIIRDLENESIKLVPFYQNLFGDIYNLSTSRLKEIVANAKKSIRSLTQEQAKAQNVVGAFKREENGKDVYDIFSEDAEGNIKRTTISLEEYLRILKQIDSLQDKIMQKSPWELIKDSFSKDENGKLKNFASGMNAIAGEVGKVADITKEFGNFAEMLGADRETIETLNDISASINGVSTAAKGIGQIASGDWLGGASSILSGVGSVVSTWLDNKNKEIDAEIKESELSIKRLDNAYKKLEYEADKAFGTAKIGAQNLAVENKKLQLAELKRQLRLEESRRSKDRDAEKIESLKGQIIDLEHEIADATQSIVNDLLGISSVGDAMENLMGNFIDALRNGEDAMQVFNNSVNDMLANMIKKMFATKILLPWVESEFQPLLDSISSKTNSATLELEEAKRNVEETKKLLEEEGADWIWYNVTKEELEEYEAELKQAEENYRRAILPDKEELLDVAEGLRTGKPILEDSIDGLKELLEALGIMNDSANKELSNLQQGISGITEDTASALESYMNGVSQQVYLHSDLLTQIRDAIVGFDIDVQTATLSEVLLQLRSSYEIQMSIRNTLSNWSSANGNSVRVEMI